MANNQRKMEKPRFNQMSRKVDELGRIVLPKEIRDANNIKMNDHLEIRVLDAGILLTPVMPRCGFCGGIDNLKQIGNGFICEACGELVVDDFGQLRKKRGAS